MTAEKMIMCAIELLGYSVINSNVQIMPRIMTRAISIINTVYFDMWNIAGDKKESFKPVTLLSDEIMLDSTAAECMKYGVAAFVAQSENDGDMQSVFMSIYNERRQGLSVAYKKSDVLPTVNL